MKTNPIDPFSWNTPDTYDPIFKPLPDGPGVYALVHNDYCGNLTIKYIGASRNLRKRLEGHSHEAFNFLTGSGLYIQRFFFETQDPFSLEKTLVGLFLPPLNKILYRTWK